MLQNYVINTRLKNFVKLLSHLFEIANWAVVDLEALLDLTEDFGEVLDPLLVGLRIIDCHAHTDVWHQRQHICVEIALAGTVPGDLLHNAEDPLLSSKLKKVHLL